MDDVRFGPDYVCLALNSGRKWVREFESGYDAVDGSHPTASRCQNGGFHEPQGNRSRP